MWGGFLNVRLPKPPPRRRLQVGTQRWSRGFDVDEAAAAPPAHKPNEFRHDFG